MGDGLALQAGSVLTSFSAFRVRGIDQRQLRVRLRLTGAAHRAVRLQVELAGERIDTSWRRPDHRLGLVGALTF